MNGSVKKGKIQRIIEIVREQGNESAGNGDTVSVSNGETSIIGG